jgi:hypothetical protein
MSDLATLQQDMAAGLLTGRYGAFQAQVLIGPVSAAEALGLHRNTVLHALTNALRLTFPTVDALVGDAFFDQAALAFVEERPPARACLTGYGSGFADFLARYDFAADLPYLPDVARLDFAVEAVGGRSVDEDGPVLELGETVMILDASLRVLRLAYPAAAIRDALDDGDDEALAAIDLEPRAYAHALWRRPEGAAIRSLSRPSAAFLDALQGGASADAALAAALAETDDLSVLQSEIFAAPFVRLTAHPAKGTIR